MLKGKVAVITGGDRGIGAAIAIKFASMGADIAILCRSGEEAASEVIGTVTERYGVKAKAYRCDVSSFEDAKAAVAEIRKDFGTAHILVNNAGITRDGLVATMKEETWDAVLDTNLKGAFNMIRHCTGLFLRNREGCIINISSVSGMMGNPGQANYSASKAGLIGLTKTVAKELGSKGIRCNAIAPGFIRTKMTEEQEDSPLLSMIPLGRMGEPEDIAQAAAYLAAAGYVTGEVLRVDGGIAM
ncbi:MAG: 3-oxoacyl-ACP reductase FabG [Firmicutes bacterium]|nr:3-oxoacyl-ACP reductase FabG [Bacillota bacterium]